LESNISILKTGDYLITSPQVALHDKLAVKYKDDILQRIVKTKARGLVLELSGIDIVDSFLVRVIGEIASSAKVMGCQVVLVGIRSVVAMTLSEMGFVLQGVHTALDLEKGIDILTKAGKR
jgi:rsbT antagonist protein RsbS